MKITKLEALSILAGAVVLLILSMMMLITLGLVASGHVIGEPNRQWAITEFMVFGLAVMANIFYFGYWLERIIRSGK